MLDNRQDLITATRRRMLLQKRARTVPAYHMSTARQRIARLGGNVPLFDVPDPVAPLNGWTVAGCIFSVFGFLLCVAALVYLVDTGEYFASLALPVVPLVSIICTLRGRPHLGGMRRNATARVGLLLGGLSFVLAVFAILGSAAALLASGQ